MQRQPVNRLPIHTYLTSPCRTDKWVSIVTVAVTTERQLNLAPVNNKLAFIM